MEKSNEPSIQNDSVVLEQTVRRLTVSKDFFAWVASFYFIATLFAVGGIAPQMMSTASKGLYPLLCIASGVLLFAGYTNWSITQGGPWHKGRFGLAGVLVGITIYIILRYFTFI